MYKNIRDSSTHHFIILFLLLTILSFFSLADIPVVLRLSYYSPTLIFLKLGKRKHEVLVLLVVFT
jgi:hypothetical protein